MPSQGNQFPILERDKAVYTKTMAAANLHHVYLSDEICEPYEYIPIINALNNAGSTDQFIFHLNTPGGNIDSAIQIVNAILQSEATCYAWIEGFCASAGTMIALACDGWLMNRLSIFMVHAPTLGNYGKFNEYTASGDFFKKWARNLQTEVYEGFLTDAEMVDCLDNNKDLWMDYEEFERRIKTLADFRKVASEKEDPSEYHFSDYLKDKEKGGSLKTGLKTTSKTTKKAKKEKLQEEVTEEEKEKV